MVHTCLVLSVSLVEPPLRFLGPDGPPDTQPAPNRGPNTAEGQNQAAARIVPVRGLAACGPVDFAAEVNYADDLNWVYDM